MRDPISRFLHWTCLPGPGVAVVVAERDQGEYLARALFDSGWRVDPRCAVLQAHKLNRSVWFLRPNDPAELLISMRFDVVFDIETPCAELAAELARRTWEPVPTAPEPDPLDLELVRALKFGANRGISMAFVLEPEHCKRLLELVRLGQESDALGERALTVAWLEGYARSLRGDGSSAQDAVELATSCIRRGEHSRK